MAELHVDPMGALFVEVFMALAFSALGVFILVGQSDVSPVLGALSLGAGALCIGAAQSTISSVVRFTLTDTALTVEWLRPGRVTKTERVARADVVDIAVAEMPTNGSLVHYGLALRTKHGDITLTKASSFDPKFHVEKRDVLAELLELPARADGLAGVDTRAADAMASTPADQPRVALSRSTI